MSIDGMPSTVVDSVRLAYKVRRPSVAYVGNLLTTFFRINHGSNTHLVAGVRAKGINVGISSRLISATTQDGNLVLRNAQPL